MRKYGLGVALFLATCLTGLAVTRAQLQTQNENTSSNIPTDIKEKIQELSSSDPVKRALAACALGKMGSRVAPAIPALISVLGDGRRVEPPQVCYSEYFAEVNVEPEFELKEPSPGEAAVQALIALGEPSIEPLIAALKDNQWRVRKNAAWALGRMEDGRALEPLIAALKDETWQVRAYAAVALGAQRSGPVTEPLINALKDANPAVRWSAVASLGRARNTRGVEPLIAALKDQHPRTRAFAAASLGQIRDTRAVLPLIDALKDKSVQVRMHAAASLGQQRDSRAHTALSAALQDEYQQVRFYARTALEQLRN